MSNAETRKPLYDDTDTYASTTEDVPCPWCGHKNKVTDAYSDLGGPEAAQMECYECEKPYTAIFSVHISVRAVRR